MGKRRIHGHLSVGLISDTHELVRPEARAALEGVAQIVHAGDVCGPGVIAALREIGSVSVVRGNRDKGRVPAKRVAADALPLELTLEFAGIRLHAVLYVNPGTAGPTRPGQPASLARLQIDGGCIAVEFVALGPSQP